jgi:hypothetical protein
MKNKNAWVAGAVLILFLSGCGSSSNDNPGAGAPAPAAGSDAFTQTVRERAASAPDNTEPVNIDAIEVTTSEKTEPEAI